MNDIVEKLEADHKTVNIGLITIILFVLKI